MEIAQRSPLVDLFRRGEVPRDVRLLAARGALAPRAHEQLALLMMLQDDRDDEIALAARETVDRLPPDVLAAFLARDDVGADVRDFFARRGIQPAAAPAPLDPAAPLVDADPGALPEVTLSDGSHATQAAGVGTKSPPISMLPVTDKVKLAMRGTREQRAVLVRDANRLVAVAALSSPKLTDSEVESFARTANVSDEVLRIIGANRMWTKNYSVVSALTRNPKTPPAIALTLLHRLNERDLKLLAVDRNVPESIRLNVRKLVAAGESRKK